MGERGDRRKSRIGDRIIAAMEASGVEPEEIARAKARKEEDEPEYAHIVVEPENADAVRLCRQMQSQWRTEVINTGRQIVIARTGLDYGALAPIAAALRIVLDESTMDGLRLLEAEMLTIHMRRQEQQLRQS
jgi:hypothetical protein